MVWPGERQIPAGLLAQGILHVNEYLSDFLPRYMEWTGQAYSNPTGTPCHGNDYVEIFHNIIDFVNI